MEPPPTDPSHHTPYLAPVPLAYRDPREDAPQHSIRNAFSAAACIVFGLGCAALTVLFIVAATQTWGDWSRFPSAVVCAIAVAFGTYASFLAARHHWRAGTARNGPGVRR